MIKFLKGHNKKEFLYNIKYTLSIVLLTYLCFFSFYLLLQVIDLFFESIDFSKLKEFKSKSDFDFEENSFWHKAISALLLAPLIEELVFREPLKLSKKNIIIPKLFLISSIIGLIIKRKFIFYLLIVYSIYLLLLFYFLQKPEKKNIVKLNVIITSILFGYLHIYTFDKVDIAYWYLYLHKVIPLAIFGFFLAKIRLKLNTYWSILGHTVFNSIPFILSIIFN